MSNETKWTSGPWVNVGGWVDSEDDSHGSIICSLSAVDRKPDYISDANANLIAAAPEMYEALKRVQQEGGMGIGLHRQIDRVMAKARGEQ